MGTKSLLLIGLLGFAAGTYLRLKSTQEAEEKWKALALSSCSTNPTQFRDAVVEDACKTIENMEK